VGRPNNEWKEQWMGVTRDTQGNTALGYFHPIQGLTGIGYSRLSGDRYIGEFTQGEYTGGGAYYSNGLWTVGIWIDGIENILYEEEGMEDMEISIADTEEKVFHMPCGLLRERNILSRVESKLKEIIGVGMKEIKREFRSENVQEIKVNDSRASIYHPPQKRSPQRGIQNTPPKNFPNSPPRQNRPPPNKVLRIDEPLRSHKPTYNHSPHTDRYPHYSPFYHPLYSLSYPLPSSSNPSTPNHPKSTPLSPPPPLVQSISVSTLPPSPEPISSPPVDITPEPIPLPPEIIPPLTIKASDTPIP